MQKNESHCINTIVATEAATKRWRMAGWERGEDSLKRGEGLSIKREREREEVLLVSSKQSYTSEIHIILPQKLTKFCVPFIRSIDRWRRVRIYVALCRLLGVTQLTFFGILAARV